MCTYDSNASSDHVFPPNAKWKTTREIKEKHLTENVDETLYSREESSNKLKDCYHSPGKIPSRSLMQ